MREMRAIKKGRKRIMINLQPITQENFYECRELKRENPYYVGDSEDVLAEGYIYKDCATVFGIYNETDMIGLVMLANEPNKDGRCDFTNLFIADNWQHKGYGKAATKTIINYFRDMGNVQYIQIMVSRSNVIAVTMYQNLGFENHGICEWDEGFYILKFYIA